MKYIVIVSVLVIIAAVVIIHANGRQQHAGHVHSGSAENVSMVCPVMGSKIPDVNKAAGSSVYNGETYHFCCEGCKPKFDENPEKYIKNKAAPKK